MKKGEKMSEEMKEKLRISHVGKKSYVRTEKHKQISRENLSKARERGNISEPWNKGTIGVMKSNSGTFKKGRRDELHPEWKGDEASYDAVHSWVNRWKGKPSVCECCGIHGKNMQWSNIDHKYRRILDDYVRMCAKCHYKYDVEVLSSRRSVKNRI